MRYPLTVAILSTILLFPSEVSATFKPNPVSIVLTVGKWIMLQKPDRKIYRIQVECKGIDVAAARSNCFQLAVEQAVGSLILSESHVRNEALLRKDIIEYSSGYVDNFKILKQDANSQGVTLQMEVDVAESKMAERVLLHTKDSARINGERVAAQIQSLNNNAVKGTQAVATVAKDFVTQAFTVQILGTQFQKNPRGGVDFFLEYYMEWNEPYLKSLEEILKLTSENVFEHERNVFHVVTKFRPKDNSFFSSNWNTSFRDPNKLGVIYKHWVDSVPIVELKINDRFGQTLVTMCRPLPKGFFYFYNNTLNIDGNFKTRQWMSVRDMPTHNLESFEKGEIKITHAGNGPCKQV